MQTTGPETVAAKAAALGAAGDSERQKARSHGRETVPNGTFPD